MINKKYEFTGRTFQQALKELKEECRANEQKYLKAIELLKLTDDVIDNLKLELKILSLENETLKQTPYFSQEFFSKNEPHKQYELLDNNKATIYHFAAHSGNINMIKTLFDDLTDNQITDISKLKTCYGHSFIHLAIKNTEYQAIIKYFSDKLVDHGHFLFSQEDDNNWTSYHYVTCYGNPSHMEVLFGNLDSKQIESICQKKTNQGSTLLHLATENRNYSEIIRYLIDKLDDYPDLLLLERDDNNWTSYHHAARYGDLVLIKRLFDCLSVNQLENVCHLKSRHGRNLLHLAAENPLYNEVIAHIKVILGKNDYVLLSVRDNNKWTSYHYAIHYGNLVCVKALFESLSVDQVKSIFEERTLQNETALQLAHANKKFSLEIVSYLTQILDKHTIDPNELPNDSSAYKLS